MRLVTYLDGDAELLGWVDRGRAVPAGQVAPGLPRTMDELIARGPEALETLRGAEPALATAVERGGVPVDRLKLLAPTPRPSKIIAVGLNYLAHPAEALDHVLGYTACNDVSARDLQAADGQWVRAKSLDTFCPLGPVLVTADEIPDPQDLKIQCILNGTVTQSASTMDMHFSVRHLISYCSAYFTLEPGDIIATGTPPGVGIYRDPPVLLSDGDEVAIDIERIGRLVNTCRFQATTGTVDHDRPAVGG